MAYSLRFVAEARAEALEQYAWYRREAGERVANRFWQALSVAVERVQARPETYAEYAPTNPELEGVRKYLLPRYPHKLVFERLGDEVVVYAVMHGKRHPDYWHSRRPR